MGTYNEAALAELSWRSFQMAERQTNNQGGLDAVAQLFSKPENLGVPLQQFIESAINSVDNQNVYQKAFQKVCNRLLTYAPEEKRAELREAILAGQIKHNPDLKKNSAVLGRELEILKKKKSGLFLSSKDTEEHQKMVKKLALVQRKLRLLSGDDTALSGIRADIAQKFRAKPLADMLSEAKHACYHYAYSKAVRQVEEPQAQGEAPKLDAEQKKEFWANRESPVQGLGPRQ